MRKSSFLLIGSALLISAGCGGNKGEGNNVAENNVAENNVAANTEAANAGAAEAANTAASNTQVAQAATTPVAPSAGPASACPIERSTDWLAEVHHHGKRVVITGTVEVKSAGYRVSLDKSQLDRGPPPVQHVTLKVKEPSQAGAQVTTEHKVKLVVRTAGPNEKVVVECAGEEIARTDVVRP